VPVRGKKKPLLHSTSRRSRNPERGAVPRATSRKPNSGREKTSKGFVGGTDLQTVQPKPFLKWAGGKRQLLPELLARVPARFGTFHEPFIGGGALFFALRPVRAVLSDSNARLIRTYQAIRDRVDDVIALLETYPYDRDFYYEFRASTPDQDPDHVLAAWMLYLNRAGYNGLYRVNSKNQFNVPFGRYTNPTLCDAENLRACSAALQGVELRTEGFEAVLQRVAGGDFVYFDPPYAPLNVTSSFTSYTRDGFGRREQELLRSVARELKRRRVHVMLSNSSAKLIRDLYSRDFMMEEVLAARNVNSKADRRGKLVELIIR
jgi:DNA adenine methylase